MQRFDVSWILGVVPLAGAAAVFALVLATTPPGFIAVPTVVVSSGADAAAYAAGAAASLALVTLLVLGALCAVVQVLVRRLHS
ncbi:MAG: hypothetical protein JO020_17140 [Chloroflexi bacterium]|nr:hypothetical protein [Chloroflexota bacterium]MBV9895892.1 hypothetical protein [Chloroflexota bacterium]